MVTIQTDIVEAVV